MYVLEVTSKRYLNPADVTYCAVSDDAVCFPSGGEALVSCGMMESLLKVINWLSEGQDHITVSSQVTL